MTKIKICGITNVNDAEFVARQGADFIGFIFYPPSSRYINPGCAADIVLQLRGVMGIRSPRFVGVFVDASLRNIKSIRAKVGLDLVQLHGEEKLDQLMALQPGAFKALRPESADKVKPLVDKYAAGMPVDNHSPQLLLDTYHPTEKGGTGQLANLDIAGWLSQRYRLLLAGGLNPDNVVNVIQIVQPWGVDVSSGVEIVRKDKVVKGSKDHQKVQAFINAVRSSTLA